MEKVVKIEIVVDLDNPEAEIWADINHFFESEVTEALEKVSPFKQRSHKLYKSEKGLTSNGSKYSLSVRRRNKK